jgi:hypothetical protein
MPEIPSLSPVYPVIKIRKSEKDDNFSGKYQHKKKPVVEKESPQPIKHIDEIV